MKLEPVDLQVAVLAALVGLWLAVVLELPLEGLTAAGALYVFYQIGRRV